MPRPPKLTKEQTAELLSAYKVGASMAALAAAYGMTAMGISKLVRRSGITPRPRGRPTRKTQLPFQTDPAPSLGSDLPPVVGQVGKVTIAVVDPDQWHVHALMRRYDLPHGQATRYMQRLRDAVEARGQQLLMLWKDEVSRPGLALLTQHKAGRNERICSARQTEVVEVDLHTARDFYDAYHLQGRINSGTTLGLTYRDRLVACMSFSHGAACRGDNSAHLLQRFAAAGSVPGGASRLLTHYRRNHPGVPIISYSDERYAPTGGLYEILGFRKDKVHKPDYRYWRDGRWHAKNTKQRKHLIREGGDAELTEHQMAAQLGYLRCYDLGKITWRLD